MGTYIILTRISPGAFKDPIEFKEVAARVSRKIKSECPEVVWKNSYVTMGRFDIVDIIESDDPKNVEKAAMIIHALGHSTTETLFATPWHEFLEMI